MKNKIKAILFDLDNTLVDTHPILKNYFFKITNYKIKPKQEAELETDNIRQINKWLKNQGIKVRSWTKIKYIIQFILTDIKHIKSIQGIPELLEELNKKIPLGIITNSPRIYANKILRLNKLKKHFQTVQTSSTNKPKPSTDMIYAAAKKMNLKPKECILVDDGASGIIAGTKAGCTTIYFSKTKNINADYYVKDVKELKTVLEKIMYPQK